MLQRAFDVGVEKIIITSGNKEEAIKSIDFVKQILHDYLQLWVFIQHVVQI